MNLRCVQASHHQTLPPWSLEAQSGYYHHVKNRQANRFSALLLLPQQRKPQQERDLPERRWERFSQSRFCEAIPWEPHQASKAAFRAGGWGPPGNPSTCSHAALPRASSRQGRVPSPEPPPAAWGVWTTRPRQAPGWPMIQTTSILLLQPNLFFRLSVLFHSLQVVKLKLLTIPVFQCNSTESPRTSALPRHAGCTAGHSSSGQTPPVVTEH